LRLDPAEDADTGRCAGGRARVFVASVCAAAGTVLYGLLRGTPDRMLHELVFLSDLTVELRAWPADTWAKVG
jgi:hypothetical protein